MEVQTLIQGVEQKYKIMLRNYNHFYTQFPHFQWLKYNWTNKYNLVLSND